jgi:hypothetical protein
MRHITYERAQTQNAHTCKKNTSFLSDQVFIFTHVHSVHFSAFSMHYPQCKTLPVRTRNCRLLKLPGILCMCWVTYGRTHIGCDILCTAATRCTLVMAVAAWQYHWVIYYARVLLHDTYERASFLQNRTLRTARHVVPTAYAAGIAVMLYLNCNGEGRMSPPLPLLPLAISSSLPNCKFCILQILFGWSSRGGRDGRSLSHVLGRGAYMVLMGESRGKENAGKT